MSLLLYLRKFVLVHFEELALGVGFGFQEHSRRENDPDLFRGDNFVRWDERMIYLLNFLHLHEQKRIF